VAGGEGGVVDGLTLVEREEVMLPLDTVLYIPGR